MAGQLCSRLDRKPEARELFLAGIGLARRQGDARALSELQAALEEVGEEAEQSSD